MRFARLIVLLLSLVLWGCRNGEAYEQMTRKSDSLSVAADFLRKQILLTDTVEIHASLDAYKRYTAFFFLHPLDTLDQTSAKYMNEYANSCATLSVCASNRTVLLSRIDVMMPQLAALSSDAKGRATDAEKIKSWFLQEQAESQRIADGWKKIRDIEMTALASCKRTQPEIETIVRRRNGGRLPELIE